MPTKKKMAQDLRDAGLRKKSAWGLAEAADRAHSGDRAARSLVDRQSTALRDGISAAVRYAKPSKKALAKKATARKPTSKKAPAKKTTARKSSSKK